MAMVRINNFCQLSVNMTIHVSFRLHFRVLSVVIYFFAICQLSVNPIKTPVDHCFSAFLRRAEYSFSLVSHAQTGALHIFLALGSVEKAYMWGLKVVEFREKGMRPQCHVTSNGPRG